MNLQNFTFETFVFQVLNGLSTSMLLFLLAAGMTLIFGLMEVVNLAHGTYYLLGAYFGYSVMNATNNFWLALVIAPLGVGVVGFVMERFFLRPLYSKAHSNMVILTLGFAYLVGDLTTLIWGGDPKSIPAPAPFDHSIELLGRSFPSYRLFVAGLGLLLALGLWLLLEKTRIGAIVRAGVSDKEMVRGMGINISLVFTALFVFGMVLAGLSGVVAAPFQSFGLGDDLRILVYSLLVVVIGGLGTLSGAFWGAIVIGLVDSLGAAYFPSFAQFGIYIVMALVLMVRPTGLFNKAQA
ncbi:MAG: branched-chain amino acid ABC transporter permease [Chloroflexi bacterium]|nr:branched-chain amino acid ABC transporter permease [Chloroflexota bacterium]OJV92282.1 MAG: branched-chain amino acid ABC transporter permease [Chloroflexi bacterium 54-19]